MGREPDYLPEGYSLLRASSGHFQIVRPDGEILRSESGLPIKVSYSPSDWRTAKNEQSRVRKAIAHLESQVRRER